MESSDIYAAFTSTKCAGCGGRKASFSAFCKWCFGELPQSLRVACHQKFSPKFEQAYMGCLSWFREHPLQGEHRAKQKSLWEDAS